MDRLIDEDGEQWFRDATAYLQQTIQTTKPVIRNPLQHSHNIIYDQKAVWAVGRVTLHVNDINGEQLVLVLHV